jgi:hypothetical protein
LFSLTFWYVSFSIFLTFSLFYVSNLFLFLFIFPIFYFLLPYSLFLVIFSLILFIVLPFSFQNHLSIFSMIIIFCYIWLLKVFLLFFSCFFQLVEKVFSLHPCFVPSVVTFVLRVWKLIHKIHILVPIFCFEHSHD